MAKKGGVQQLQADLQTDEDFEKFLERPGLLVLDVYSEWCGPCLGMVGSLRKIKLEIGGDNLQLAICKSDTITALKRFNKKSEPTWLFVTNGKAVHIAFGTDVPKLVNLITRELDKVVQKVTRSAVYDIWQLQPIEVEHLRIKTEAIAKAERIEHETKHRKRVDYLNSVTDIIMDNIPDIGVTIFGPQVNRDMFKKLTEPAEPLKMQCKDRKVVQVTLENFETVNYACKNPLSEEVLEQFDGKELLMCFWKVDETIGSVPNVLMTYAHELTKERVAPPDETNDEEHVIPPIIEPMKVKFEVEVQEGEVWVEEVSSEEERAKAAAKAHKKSGVHIQDEAHVVAPDEEAEDDVEEEVSEEEVAEAVDAMPGFPDTTFEMGDMGDLGDELAGEEEEEAKEEEPPKKLMRTKTVKLPPIWVPNNRRSHAALIYVFFRSQTTGFLPPDPKPEPPHVIMAFDASKRREIMHVVERHKDDVPLYGYFNTDDPDEAQLIANSTDKYNTKEISVTDKIVLKVNKVQSNMMLSLVSYGPSYVSPNVRVGHDEALKFFPEDYKMQDEAPPPEKRKSKERKKSKGSVPVPEKASVERLPSDAAPTEEVPAPAPEEGDVAGEAVAAAEATAEAGAEPPDGAAAAEAPLPAAETANEVAGEPTAEAPAPAAEAPAAPADEPPPDAPAE